MKFKIDRSSFYEVLSELSRSISAKAEPQIMNGIKMTAHSEGVTLIVSNHLFFVEKTIPLEAKGQLTVYETGSVVVPAKYLVELVKKLPGELTVELIGQHKLSIKTEEISVVLSSFDVEAYPNTPVLDLGKGVQIPGPLLNEMISQTAFAASSIDNRPVLTGLLVTLQENKIICAATNSHRLAMRESEIEIDIEGSYIIPLASVKEFMRLFNSSKDLITVYICGNHLVFKTLNLAMYTRLIEGNYPNLNSLIPAHPKTMITVQTSKLLKGIDRASLFNRESRNNNVKLELINGSTLKITSYSPDLGKIEETQQIIDVYGEKELSLSLNSIFLIEALKAFTEEEVTLNYSGSMRPILIKPNSNKRHLHLISPVRG
ncbi:DNA polymerase III subunit beta [Mesobacillus jeotgali]|uniref:DNA polymerase III subunit beta n=1 Tax=Mesobacillus jeotgali TaxID=129985 RepID=UPI00177BFAF1|nr:DNA polymerase III subunit beta [Mesobacillus jeotgali]UYZ20271.1 DNA polymerase III subunit beta [Mesobacillus jeotgali]